MLVVLRQLFCCPPLLKLAFQRQRRRISLWGADAKEFKKRSASQCCLAVNLYKRYKTRAFYLPFMHIQWVEGSIWNVLGRVGLGTRQTLKF